MRLKTYLRLTMTQNRLIDLAILAIESSSVIKVLTEDMNAMIDTFGERAAKRAQFSLKSVFVLNL